MQDFAASCFFLMELIANAAFTCGTENLTELSRHFKCYVELGTVSLWFITFPWTNQLVRQLKFSQSEEYNMGLPNNKPPAKSNMVCWKILHLFRWFSHCSFIATFDCCRVNHTHCKAKSTTFSCFFLFTTWTAFNPILNSPNNGLIKHQLRHHQVKWIMPWMISLSWQLGW